MSDTTHIERQTSVWVRMIIGSGLGFCFFMLPISWGGDITIPIALLKDTISAPIKEWLPLTVVILAVFAAVASLIATATNGGGLNKYLKGVFAVPWLSVVFRVAAAILAVLAYWKIGPEPIWNDYTGQIIIVELMPSLLVIFFLATTLLPLLLDFGGVEFVGVYLQPFFKKVFKLPGRASVLSATSWIGSGTNGIIAAELDYKKGLYTGREISILCLGFGTISLPAIFVYTTAIGGVEAAHFLFFVVTLFVVGIVSTMILARVPPLSIKANTYYQDKMNPILEQGEEETLSKFEQAKDIAYQKAEDAPSIGTIIKNGALTTFSLYMSVFPLIILIGILALVATEYTPLFKWLAIPLEPALSAIGLPEAQAAAPAFLVGFADLLLPFLAAESIESQLTKFVICITGTITVICMSETGAILLKSAIPLTFLDLLFVFLIKTAVAVPIALAMGRLYGLT